jgi:hypothetical protein
MRPVQPSVVAVQRHVMLSAMPSSGIVNSVIRITGIGDQDRPEWLIRISGIRRYANLPAEYNIAMKNRNAARWLDLMRKNAHNTALDGCTEVKQPAGGKACSFVLWTELPPAK